MSKARSAPTPITILTGFLGSGKTTLILNLLPQLPSDYKLALLKNEFGVVAIDSQLASRSSISGVQELLNGCICCNLVGQLGDALQALRNGVDPSSANGDTTAEGGSSHRPDRIIIETSGSAFPATLAMEVNRLAAETGAFSLDGVVSVIDVENWQGYEDTSVTAKMQARYTDLIILNKWEHVSERRLDDVLDRIGDLELDPPTPCIKSRAGVIDREAILGLDGALARKLGSEGGDDRNHKHDHSHSDEVEVISAVIEDSGEDETLDASALQRLLEVAQKDEVYRIKGVFLCREDLKSSNGDPAAGMSNAGSGQVKQYILNWAFGRWTFTVIGSGDETGRTSGPLLKMTAVTAKYESSKWMKRIEDERYLRPLNSQALMPAKLKKLA